MNAGATKRTERRRRGGKAASGHANANGNGKGDGGGRARALAALAVDHVLSGGRTLDDAFAQVLNDDIPRREQSQVKALAFGALRWHHRHRLIIGELLERPLRSRDRVLEALLSVGIFELIDARQPGYAAVSSAVDAARRLKRPRATGLVNATLRRFGRESGELLSAALADETGRFAHPRWLIEQMRKDWPDQWDTALTAALEQPPMWLRVNSARSSPAEYAQRVERECGIDASTQDGFPDALRIRRALPVADLPGFADGDVSVQDASAQLAAELLAPEPDMRVLDACAAPGGKAVHLLERGNGQLQLTTVDIDGNRNRLLEDNLRRAGYQADVLTGDACDVDEWAAGRRFDRILLDAPCSATGVIRRHPDIKFLRRAADIDALAERQLTMLASLWPLLENGGRLLYATCSVLRAENDAVVTRFLAMHADAAIVDPGLDAMGHAVELAGPGIQLLPGSAGTDGFYYALMERKG
ncbi:MAG: 16S rRNA (cytosine(967)-C(5))-methyltransferase RsmB [Gammaproteobacteria bacterium]